MPTYKAPVEDVTFLLNDVFQIDRYDNLPGFTDASADVREAILGETGHVISAPFGDKRGVLRFATPKLGSEEWQFICQQPVVVGDRVAVDDVSGNTLIVSKR